MLQRRSLYANKIIGVLSAMLLLVAFLLNITGIRADIMLQVAIYWAIFGFAILGILLRGKITFTNFLLLLFSVYIVLITWINQSFNTSTLFINFGYMTLWIWVIQVFTCVNGDDDFYERLFNWITVFSILMGIYIILDNENRKLASDWGFVNTNYYLLCALPIILLAKNRVIRRIAIVVACLTVLFSLKRTGILALIISGIFIVLYNLRGKSRFKLKTFMILSAFILLMLGYGALSETLGVDFFSRFDSLGVDGGSGRIDIYQQWFEVISNSSALRLLFGCGYNGFINVYGSYVSCHNDIMELVIDYGLFGLTIYAVVIIKYVKACIYNIKYALPYARACIVSLCSFGFITMFGHCFLYPSYFMFILIFWVYIENKTNSTIKERLKSIS